MKAHSRTVKLELSALSHRFGTDYIFSIIPISQNFSGFFQLCSSKLIKACASPSLNQETLQEGIREKSEHLCALKMNLFCQEIKFGLLC